jgi:hypothetical protein
MYEAASSGEIPRCEAPSLAAYRSASWREPLRTSASTVSEPRSRQAMVAVDEQQTFWGVEDDYGRQGVEHLGVALHSRGVEICLRLDRRVREEIDYSRVRHRTHSRCQPEPLQSPFT